MTEVVTISAEKILSFIQGGDLIDITVVAKNNPDLWQNVFVEQ